MMVCALSFGCPQRFLYVSQIAFVTTTASGYRETRLWVNYHRVIGVTHFYLFVDGVAARPEVTPPPLLHPSAFPLRVASMVVTCVFHINLHVRFMGVLVYSTALCVSEADTQIQGLCGMAPKIILILDHI